MKRIKRTMALLLALVLIFCTVSMSASATLYGTGTKQEVTVTTGNVTLTGRVTCYSSYATAKTTFSVSSGTVYAHVGLYFSTPASPADYVLQQNQNSASGKTVSTTTYIDTSLYTAQYARGGHDVVISGYANPGHAETFHDF